MNPIDQSIEQSVKLNLEQPHGYGQDLTELLHDIFGDICQTPEDEVFENLTQDLPLDNEYSQKYAEKLQTLCQMRRNEKRELQIVDAYLKTLNPKKSSEKILDYEITDEIEDTLDTMSELNDEILALDVSPEEETELTDDKKIEVTWDDNVAEDEDVPSFSVDPDFMSKTRSFAVSSFKMDISSEFSKFSTKTTSADESLLIQKYAVLFSEPLFFDDDTVVLSSPNYPSNRGLKSHVREPKIQRHKKDKQKCLTKTRRLGESKDGGDSITCVKSVSLGLTKSTTLQTEKFVFKAIPSEVVFTDCKPDKIYQTILKLRNITDIAQSCSVVPPKSGVFLIGEGQYPTKNRRYIAPGLSCKYVVRFRPKLFKDYVDEVTVVTSQGTSFSVKILAKRTEPQLELMDDWDCGDCFINSYVKKEFTINNVGGSGKFLLFIGDLDGEKIENMFKPDQVLDKEMLKLQYFRISPSYFSLETTQSTTFSVDFAPISEGRFSDKIFVICDNVKIVANFSITGRSLYMNSDIITLHGHWNYPRPQDVWDAFTKYFLNFENVYAHKYKIRSFTLKNNCTFPLKFKWESIQPRPDPHLLKFITVVEPSLAIFPASGTVPPNEEELFSLYYKPVKEMNLHLVYQLVILDIPIEALDKNMDKYLIFSEDFQKVDVRVQSVNVQGKCCLYDLTIQPPELIIPGLLEVGITHRQLITVSNSSAVTTCFEWNRITSDNIIEVGPVAGYVGKIYRLAGAGGPVVSAIFSWSQGASQEMNLEVLITPTKTGKYVETLECRVQDSEKLLLFTVRFEVIGPKVIIEAGNVNLGLIRIGTTVRGGFTLRNTVSGNVSWRLSDVAQRAPNDPVKCSTEIFPSCGELDSLSRQSVVIILKPDQIGSLHKIIELEVEGAISGHISVFGEVLAPRVCLQECTFFAGTVYRSIPFNSVITLINQTPLDANFSWEEAEGVDAQSCTIKLDPAEGVVLGGECKTVMVTCTVNQLISFHDVCIPCWINGMNEPLYWSVCGEVNGIEIFCSLDMESRRYCATLREGGCDDEPHFDLDFGSEVSLGSVVVREIHLTNNSAITAKYEANLKNFSALPNDEINQELIDQTKKHVNLSSKRINELLKRKLETASGLALLVYPSVGWILPFSCVNIQMIGKSDMWGLYKDLFTIQITELKLIHVNVCYNSVGIPFRFIAARRDDNRFILRFGSHLKNSSPVSRNVKIENTGPCDLTVEFKNYVSAEENYLVRTKLVRVDLFYDEAIDYKHASECEKCKKCLHLYEPNAREKLIRLAISPYVGDGESQIFSLIPNIITLKSRSEATLIAKFNPPVEKQNRDVVNFCCHTAGLVSIPRKILSIPNKVYRQHKRGVKFVEMEMTARLINPRLFHCESEENEFYFELNAGEFLFGKPDVLELDRIISFVNLSSVAINVRCSTFKPFRVIECKVNSKNVTKIVGLKGEIVLQPADILKVAIKFMLSRALVDELCCNRPCFNDERESCRVFDNENPNRLVFDRELVVKIGETDTENHPLRGIIHLPFLLVTTSNLDFGTCLVGQFNSLEIGLLNFSECDTSFCVVYEDAINEFRLDPTEGIVPQKVDEFTPGRTDLDVYFQPKCNVCYQQYIVIYGPFGMEPQRVLLEGKGTSDQSYKRDYDVTSS